MYDAQSIINIVHIVSSHYQHVIVIVFVSMELDNEALRHILLPSLPERNVCLIVCLYARVAQKWLLRLT